MKLAVIAIVALLLVGGGAAGAYFYFDKPAEAAGGPVDEAAKAEHEAKKEAAKEGEPAPQAQFVQLDPLILPLIGESGVTQTISIVVSLEVPDAASAEEVKRLSPRLRDAYIQDMYGALSRKSAMKDGVLQVDMIKQRLNRASIKVLGEGKFKEVLLQIVQQRSI
jgi:flagellar FliL protein